MDARDRVIARVNTETKRARQAAGLRPRMAPQTYAPDGSGSIVWDFRPWVQGHVIRRFARFGAHEGVELGGEG